MKIRQFRYSADNLGYLVYGERTAIAIDGGAVDAIVEYLASHHLELKIVTHTHSHHDHTTGADRLRKKTGAKPLSSRSIAGKKIDLEGETVQVVPTPGHTADSVVFAFDRYLVTGDTLFNGTVGNCFSGDLDGFYRSLKKLLEFPEETIVYAGHDYVLESLDIAKRFEPSNTDIDRFSKTYTPDHVCSTLADEKKINPYLRFNAPEMVSMMKKMNLPTATEFDRFKSMMTF